MIDLLPCRIATPSFESPIPFRWPYAILLFLIGELIKATD